MSTKKHKPLGSAMEKFVFGTQEAASPPTAPEAASPAPTPTAPTTYNTIRTRNTAHSGSCIASANHTKTGITHRRNYPVQLKEPSLTHRLQAPDKEATIRFTVDMSETLHRKLSMLAAKTGRKKVDIVRMLLEEGLKEVEG